ncbi:MAG: hypothetical protein QF442_00300 [Candidatus Peribacteraceae bacterium]|jgi:hypothetical protein|nr:hypothetical protein [Candidatus Peribacteraceae bacterium]
MTMVVEQPPRRGNAADPPDPPNNGFDGGDDWWNRDEFGFFDKFIRYGSIFLLGYHAFFCGLLLAFMFTSR